ncbi:MAG: hypothetical protein RJQ00_03670 [Vicingaceae bacterium]
MKLTLIALLFLLFAGYASSCGDDDETACIDCPNPNADTLFVNDTFLTYWHFPVGSWWVYKRIDTSAEVYDTATVVRSVYEVINNSFSEFARENYEMNIEHTYYRSAYDGGKGNQFVNTDFPGDRISSTANTKAGFNYTYFFSWSIDSTSIKDKSFGGGGDSFLVVRKDTTIRNVKNTDYITIEFNVGNASTYISLAKEIGFVKYVHLHDNSQWKLVNFNINN